MNSAEREILTDEEAEKCGLLPSEVLTPEELEAIRRMVTDCPDQSKDAN